MKKSEELFVLVKSLSQAEKRYFRVFCGRESGANGYIKLFDELAKQSTYDAAKIRKKLKGEAMLNQLHVTKNYLRQLILKSLRNFHAGVSKDAEVKDLLRGVEILFNKELYQHCFVELNRAERIADEYELFSAMIEIQSWKRKILQHTRPYDHEGLRILLDQQNMALNKLTNGNKYSNLIVDVSLAMEDRSFNDIPNARLLESVEESRSFESRVVQANAQYFKLLVEDRAEEGEKVLYDLLEYMDGMPHRIRESPGLYLTTANNFITYFVFSKRPEEALELIQRAKALINDLKLKSENRTILKQVLRTYNIELEVYRDADLIQENIVTIREVEQFILLHQQKVPKDYLISYWFQLAYINFVLGEFKLAVGWVNRILQFKDRKIRPDIQAHARFLNLMIHLDLKNLFALGYFVASAKRFVKKVKVLDDHEKELLKFFGKVSRVPLLEIPAMFNGLKQLVIVGVEDDDPIFQQDFIDYQSWIEARSC